MLFFVLNPNHGVIYVLTCLFTRLLWLYIGMYAFCSQGFIGLDSVDRKKIKFVGHNSALWSRRGTKIGRNDCYQLPGAPLNPLGPQEIATKNKWCFISRQVSEKKAVEIPLLALVVPVKGFIGRCMISQERTEKINNPLIRFKQIRSENNNPRSST